MPASSLLYISEDHLISLSLCLLVYKMRFQGELHYINAKYIWRIARHIVVVTVAFPRPASAAPQSHSLEASEAPALGKHREEPGSSTHWHCWVPAVGSLWFCDVRGVTEFLPGWGGKGSAQQGAILPALPGPFRGTGPDQRDPDPKLRRRA